MDALHAVRAPWGVSAHEAQEALVELGTRTPPPTCHVRLGSRDLAGMSRTRAVELGRRLRDAAGLGAWTRDGDDPWFGARILSGDDASRALDITTRHSTSGLDDAARQLNRILSESHVPEANSLEDWKSAFATMSSVRETLEVFRPEVFDIPLKEHIAATATRDWREARDVEMGWLDRWKIRRQTKRLLRPGRPPANLHEELVVGERAARALVRARRRRWTARDLTAPRRGAGAARRAHGRPRVARRRGCRSGPTAQTLTSLPLRDLRDRLAALASRPDRIAVLPQVTTALDELRAAGLGPVVDDLAARGVPTDRSRPRSSTSGGPRSRQEITVRDPAYGAHDGEGLRRDVAEFAEADRAHLAATVARVRAAVARNVREVLADHPAHEALVRAEAGKARRHRPLRDLMPQAATTLTAIKPCWAMSPLVVASTLPPGRWFDVVIFDEASQVQPAQAISAISRARQVVVAGDERQLPPTNFFTVVSDDEPDAGAADRRDADRGLRVGARRAGRRPADPQPHLALPQPRRAPHRLRQRRRCTTGVSRPSPARPSSSAVTFEPVDGQAVVQPGVDTIETTDGRSAASSSSSSSTPAPGPTESLGVIALGIKHADRLEEALRRRPAHGARRSPPSSTTPRDERFFVKNLERVQGDERDAIILSIGYGKTPHGRVLHRFGPLNIEGGERRLNVAITRARCRMTVVSALRAVDLDPSRLKARGALMLRDFLAYAEGRRRAPATRTRSSRPPPSRATRCATTSRSACAATGSPSTRTTAPRATASTSRSRTPTTVAVALIAVETDGERYAALRSTRDRDRLRPEQLARLGWVHERVWSTDVFRDPAREIARIVTLARSSPPPAESPATPSTQRRRSTDQSTVLAGRRGAVASTPRHPRTATRGRRLARPRRRRAGAARPPRRRHRSASGAGSSARGPGPPTPRPRPMRASRGPRSAAAATSSTSGGASDPPGQVSVTGGSRSSDRPTTSDREVSLSARLGGGMPPPRAALRAS